MSQEWDSPAPRDKPAIFRCPVTTAPPLPEPAPAEGQADREVCAKCGHPRSEHHYNGACYGICGKFVAPVEGQADVSGAIKYLSDERPLLFGSIARKVVKETIDRLRQEVAGRYVGRWACFECGTVCESPMTPKGSFACSTCGAYGLMPEAVELRVSAAYEEERKRAERAEAQVAALRADNPIAAQAVDEMKKLRQEVAAVTAERDMRHDAEKRRVGQVKELVRQRDEAEAQVAQMRAALVTILGWRERDREDMAEVIRFIEATASAALSALPQREVERVMQRHLAESDWEGAAPVQAQEGGGG